MEKIQKILDKTSSSYPYTAAMRNFIATSSMYSIKHIEWQKNRAVCLCVVQLFERGGRFKSPVLCLEREGPKKETFEALYLEVYKFLELLPFEVQGDVVVAEETTEGASKEENVIITAPEGPTGVASTIKMGHQLDLWSNSEKYYDFTEGNAAVMNRWFPLDSVRVSTANSREKDGGLLKSWKIPEALIMGNFSTVNIMPMRCFMLGQLDLEFKMVLQANPFQACCVMLGTIPNSYGLDPGTANITGIKCSSTGVNMKSYPYSYEKSSSFSYSDFQVAVQRPNVMVDVNSGGEAILQVVQKYHKTLMRPMDFSFMNEVNPGFRGSMTSTLTLHLLSDLRTGSGSDTEFYIRVFYRFTRSQLTAMTAAAGTDVGVVKTLPKMTSDGFSKYWLREQQYRANKQTMPVTELATYLVQGGVLGIARGAITVADTVVGAAEKIGTQGRKGFVTMNRDKPRESVGVVQTVPRPRRDFPNGTGLDDSLIMATNWDQVVEFFERFDDEPKNYKDFVSIPGYHGSFKWSKTNKTGSQLYEWNVSPVFVGGDWSLDANKLRSPLAIASSSFTNYWGTMEVMFQFVKTNFHRGALEISVQFGKTVKGSAMESSYVKVITVQENSAFSVTVPYIYDTVVKSIPGTCAPMYLPNVTNPTSLQYYRSCFLTVRVLNELTCPNTVTSEIEVLMWIKGGQDFGLNIVRPVNTLSFVDTPSSEMLLPPSNVRDIMASNAAPAQLLYNVENAGMERIPAAMYLVQGDDDFEQRPYVANRMHVQDHMDFKNILKMPVKVLNHYKYLKETTLEYVSETKTVPYTMRNYFCMPVAPLSATLIHYLNSQHFNEKCDVLKNSNSVYGGIPIQQSPQFLINSLFGMFRGSLTYTILVHTQKPVYVAYMPNDYSLRKLCAPLSDPPKFVSGVYTLKARDTAIGVGSDSDIDLAQIGLYNSIIVPQINPTEKIEIPYTHCVNWLLMNRRMTYKDRKTAGLQTLRENLEWFNGHLVLWSDHDFEFDLYMSCADDLELGGFLGSRGVVNPWGSIASVTDNWRVQSDFSLAEVTSNGWNSFKTCVGRFGMSGLCGVIGAVTMPLLRPIPLGAMAFFALGGYNEIVAFRNGLRKLDEQAQTKIVDRITTEGAKLLLGVVREAFPLVNISAAGLDNLWAAAQHVIHVAMSRNWANAAFGFFCMMVKLEVFSLSDWVSLKDNFVNLFRATGSEFVVQSEAGDAWGACIEVLATLFCGKMQLQMSGGMRQLLMEIFQWQNFKVVSGINSITQLIRNLVKAINTIFSYLTEEKDPRIKLQKLLSAQGSEVADFVEEATHYLNFVNDSECRKKETRVRFLMVIIRAYKLKAVLVELCNPQLTMQLMTLCNEVIKKATSQRYLFKCDLVKSEPFVLCVEGQSQLGKSFATYDLAVEGLSEIGVKGNIDCVFTVSPGVKYWNGYMDQPVIWYDDWCNLTDDETMKDHLSQLYALKTSAPFNVPRAELENKEQIAAPNLVIMTTNNPFPRHVSMHCPQAVYRRRDMLVRFELREGLSSVNDASPSELERFEHLRVRVYSDPTDPASVSNQLITYQEFVVLYRERMKLFHKRECENKEKKYKKLLQLVKTTELDRLDLGNPFEELERANEEVLIKDLPSFVVEREVKRLHELLQNHLELLKIRVRDDEVFVAQVDDEFLEPREIQGEETNFQYLFPVGRVYAEGESMPERVDPPVDETLSWWRKLLDKVYRKATAAGMICWRCGGEASVKGTSFWCAEHSHHVCFHCGTFRTIPYAIERESREVFMDVICPLHNSSLYVRHHGIVRDLMSSLLNMICLKPMMLIAGFIQLCTNPELQQLYRHLNILKSLIRTVILATPAAFLVQGDEIGVDGQYDGYITTNNYKVEDSWAPTAEQANKLRALFLKLDIATTSKETYVYVCPHSILGGGFLYREGNYYPIVTDDEELIIPDRLCKGKCVMTNQRWLAQTAKLFCVSERVMTAYNEGKMDLIEKMIPRFGWTAAMVSGIKRRTLVRKIVRADWWENYVFPKCDAAWQFIKKVAPIVAICAAVWGAAKGFNCIWEWLRGVMGFDCETPIWKDKTNGFRTNRKRGKTKTPFATQAMTENMSNKMNKIIANYIVIAVGDKRMTAWGLKGSTFILPRHLATRIRRFTKFELYFLNSVSRSLVVLVEDCEFRDYSNRDLCAVTIKGVPVLFKDCTSFLPTSGNQFTHAKGVVLAVDAYKRQVVEKDTRLVGIKSNFTARDGDEDVLSESVVMHTEQAPGLCGSLVCVDSNSPILAMHIAGSGAQQKGVGIMIYREDFQVQSDIEEIEDTGECCTYYGDDCLLGYEAVLPKDMIPYMSSVTSIRESMVAQDLPPTTMAPAFLSSIEGYPHDHSPLYYGVRKNGFPPRPFGLKNISRALRVVSNLILGGTLIRRPQVLTFNEAILGLPGQYVDDPYLREGDIIYYGPLPLDTSAGFPFTTPRYRKQYGRGPKKSEWIQVQYEDSYPTGCVVHEEIVKLYEHQMELRRKGVVPANLFQDCLKDERRPIPKMMKEGGTRLFSMSNVVGSIALRQYTLDLTSFMRRNRIGNGSAVGINPESMEWTVLAHTLLSMSPHIFTTDFTNFGAGLDYGCGMAFVEVIKQFYELGGSRLTAQDSRIIDVMMQELMGSRHVVGGLVYATYCGSPSGAAITVEINSFVHMMYVVISWILVTREVRSIVNDGVTYLDGLNEYLRTVVSTEELGVASRWMAIDTFRDSVIMVVYGDDGIFSVRSDIRNVFNAQTINLALGAHGIGVTDASKASEIVPYTVLSEVSFLKRSFVPHPYAPSSIYMAKIAWETVEECAKWIHKNEMTPEEATYENCYASLQLAFGWGREKFEEWKATLNCALDRHKLRRLEIDWDDLCYTFYPTLSVKEWS
ncbi:hypothetical protein [Hubei picorna-like virus 34]|uniref:hypothetical protein n=1 Tax=Hubei picorna-like virus 34 TaxID=1923114 RepID=UPI00090B59E8|nr:hypothetical protein [Hubei picorna-like virus 34]APG77959.1 hypothetical protein [Hubei picorna-like virus 34]